MAVDGYAAMFVLFVGCTADVAETTAATFPGCAGPERTCTADEECFTNQCALAVCDAGSCAYYDHRNGEQCIGHAGNGNHLVGMCDKCDCRLPE